MEDVLRFIAEEMENFAGSSSKRDHVIFRCEELFDEFFVPLDLPGPDVAIDPILRLAIRPIVGRIYDEILKKLERQSS